MAVRYCNPPQPNPWGTTDSAPDLSYAPFPGRWLGCFQNDDIWFLVIRVRLGLLGIGWGAGLVGLWSIVQYVFGLAPSIETVLYHDLVLQEGGNYPGRPSPHTAVVSLLVGLLVGLSPLSDPKLQRLALVIGIAGFVTAWLALFGYATLTRPVYSVAGDPQTGMSLIGSLGFLALVIGSFGLRPDQGFVGLLRSQSSGGLIVRLLLPAAIVTPLIFGWLAVYEARSGILET